MKPLLKSITILIWLIATIYVETLLFRNDLGKICPARMILFGFGMLAVLVVITEIWENTSDQNDSKMEM